MRPLLIVEDDEMTRAFLLDNLAAEGFRVAGAGSVGEGLRAIEVRQPALVVLDLGLGGETGRRLDRPRVHATAARARSLMAAAQGDLDGALRHAEQALEHHERLPDPLERGRTLIVLGTVHRRAKRKAAAREALQEALDLLEAIGARLWADRARAELGRIGGRVRSGDLTPTETRVAELVAEGRTNSEVAAALFVSVRTVEANLTRIYAKLGVRSRTELASRHRPA